MGAGDGKQKKKFADDTNMKAKLTCHAPRMKNNNLGLQLGNQTEK